MAFEKLTGLVNLEELEKESDLFNVNGGTVIIGTIITEEGCVPKQTFDCVVPATDHCFGYVVTCVKTCSAGTRFCNGTHQCGCCDDNHR